MPEVTEAPLFDTELLPAGQLALGLPEEVAFRAEQMALSSLITQPKHSIYDTANDREVIFDEANLTWTDWRGSMCWTVTAHDVLVAGARSYLDQLGAAPDRFGTELVEIADKAMSRYQKAHNG